jgi:ER-bound oxygenase mpaB/B'/Rubber oxygenase, catalytic domain
MFIETRTFGTAAEAGRAGRRVRKIHESLTGTDPDGTRYRVDEPGLLLWVHCGEVASAVDIARRSGLPFSTLPGWARRMYGRPSGPLSETAATAGLRAARLLLSQERLFSAAMRAVHRAESAADNQPGEAASA